uniref:N-acetylglucosaminyl deacetylase LmbE family n=1 Tax=Rathayibacter iranicus TaxID=59737 RepID=A0A5J6SG22_9MICO|nr:N-acetylglucosaminyl deacetylase LmbE family [Rathayibacter iranicus]QFF92422.1 N-acetylglucosaminyl deacetylase LmbE family [Rathayibacter iranicus]
MARALAIVAHPDDEVLGVGGTLASLSASGVEVFVAVACEGVGLRHGTASLDSVRARTSHAASLLGVSRCLFGSHGLDGRLLADQEQSEVVRYVERLIEEVRPQVVFTHASQDIHADHRSLRVAVLYASRTFVRPFLTELMLFETLSSTEQGFGITNAFRPNTFVDVSGHMSAKLAALSLYEEELGPFPHPRSREAVEGLAVVRGAQAGFNRAEAFEMVFSKRRSLCFNVS